VHWCGWGNWKGSSPALSDPSKIQRLSAAVFSTVVRRSVRATGVLEGT
jgi:hypothetical protein